MSGGKRAGIDLEYMQKVADDTFCRGPANRPGTLGVPQAVAASFLAATSPPVFLYCVVWSAADRRAFWTGFLGRIDYHGDELQAYFVWFRNCFGLGEQDGAFAQAWSDFGSTMGQLAELGWKMSVVAGVPAPMVWHPKREAYAREISALGLQLTQQLIAGYKKAYWAGGVPQCTGVLLADMLRLIFEAIATKGLAKGASTIAGSRLLNRLPPTLHKIPSRITQPPSRHDLINYITHDKTVALHGRGVLTDLKPGQFLVRVEARSATRPGNWFNGPFGSREEAKRYAQYLADLGESGIRRDSALPRVWEDGAQGNRIEVIRVYEVNHPSPVISSVVAPQRETGTVMVRPEHRAALRSGRATDAAEYAGQGQQLSVPVTQAHKVHELELVKRVSGDEIKVTKP